MRDIAWDIFGNDDNSRASAVAADGRKVFHNAVSAKTCVLGPEPGKVSYLLAWGQNFLVPFGLNYENLTCWFVICRDFAKMPCTKIDLHS